MLPLNVSVRQEIVMYSFINLCLQYLNFAAASFYSRLKGDDSGAMKWAIFAEIILDLPSLGDKQKCQNNLEVVGVLLQSRM